MPIANCVVTQSCKLGSADLIEVWSRESGISSEHMTLNIISCEQQFGNAYAVMASLYLPSMWPSNKISAIQTGLAQALAECFELPLSDVHVITNIVSSGLVVERGQEVSW